MKTINKQSNRKGAFTIVELLTVMSIIVILIGLLVPALNKVRKFAKEVKQNAQFHSMDAAIELFNNEFDGYPESGALDTMGDSYCGAMKFCEAMMGQDVLGFHPESIFRRDGRDMADTTDLYITATLAARSGPYLPPESADAVEVGQIWIDPATGSPDVGPSFDEKSRVLCDVYRSTLPSGIKVGMPILYYKADIGCTLHDDTVAEDMTPFDRKDNIYSHWDNQELVELGVPGAPSGALPFDLLDPWRFYRNTKSDKITSMKRPFKADTYILISAGYDGRYGTADDLCNFEWKYRH